jgi:hypothetical protein
MKKQERNLGYEMDLHIRGNSERISWDLFDTAEIVNGITQRVVMFNLVRGSRQESNMYFPGFLPSPQAFLIDRIRIFGLRQSMLLGTFELHLGAKLYDLRPAWRYAIREKYEPRISLFIAPEMNFNVILEWKIAPCFQGNLAVVQVVLCGKLIRPIQ